MPVLWLMATTMALRADAPAITLAQASAMSPAQLGDALLAPGHPAITEAEVGVQGMMPPPPPGALLQSPIELVSAAEPSKEAGFCERSVAHILLAPVRFTGGEAPAARPVQVDTEQTYSWRVKAGERTGCSVHSASYFSVQGSGKQQAFALIRALANLQAQAKGGRRIEAELTVDDREAQRWREFARTNTDPGSQPTPKQLTAFTDGRTALSALPIGDIGSIAFGRQSWHEPLRKADLIGNDGVKRNLVTVFAGGVWTIDMALDGNKISVIRIVREMPPPF